MIIKSSSGVLLSLDQAIQKLEKRGFLHFYDNHVLVAGLCWNYGRNAYRFWDEINQEEYLFFYSPKEIIERVLEIIYRSLKKTNLKNDKMKLQNLAVIQLADIIKDSPHTQSIMDLCRQYKAYSGGLGVECTTTQSIIKRTIKTLIPNVPDGLLLSVFDRREIHELYEAIADSNQVFEPISIKSTSQESERRF